MLQTAEGRQELDMTVDASLYGLFAFGAYDSRDPRVAGSMRAVESELWVPSAVGGVARYQGDLYHRTDGAEGPGNPWVICTVWLAQYHVARAERREDLEAARQILGWVAGLALPSGVLAEQLDPATRRPLSVAPLTWSHAAFVTAVQEYLDKLHSLDRCSECGGPASGAIGPRARRAVDALHPAAR
jgi:GH15 family glucan-1,4-alpha-glucosidase